MSRRFAPAFAVPSAEPISALNTTPLIDVMLVLLIMFIITIPVTSHKVALDLPSGPVDEFVVQKPHLLDIDQAGRLYWDGAGISEARLPSYLTALRDAGPEAVLHFRADGQTRYEDFDRVLAAIKRAGIERLGLVGNERFASSAS
jgi:biopolymer transport protein ExbD